MNKIKKYIAWKYTKYILIPMWFVVCINLGALLGNTLIMITEHFNLVDPIGKIIDFIIFFN